MEGASVETQLGDVAAIDVDVACVRVVVVHEQPMEGTSVEVRLGVSSEQAPRLRQT